MKFAYVSQSTMTYQSWYSDLLNHSSISLTFPINLIAHNVLARERDKTTGNKSLSAFINILSELSAILTKMLASKCAILGIHSPNIFTFFSDYWAWPNKSIIFCSFGEREAIINVLTHMYILTKIISSIASHFAPWISVSSRDNSYKLSERTVWTTKLTSKQ